MKFKELLKTFYRRFRNKKVSYSQTGEDLICDFYFFNKKQGFYVDIGANDPVFLNNTYFFYKKGWRGICVEPNSFRANLIKHSRPGDVVLNVGVASKEGSMDFYKFDPDTISTFSESEAAEFKKLGHKLLEVFKVKVMTLKDIIQNNSNGREIDLISIDTEGFDMEVLKSNDWQNVRPKIIITEVAEYRGHTLIRKEKEFTEFLASKDYYKLADTYINGLYIEKKFAIQKDLMF